MDVRARRNVVAMIEVTVYIYIYIYMYVYVYVYVYIIWICTVNTSYTYMRGYISN